MRLVTPALVTLSLFSLFSSLVFGGTTGKIAGRITDAESGEALPGANIVIEGTNEGAASDVHGNFVILNLPPGLYTLRISFLGYQTLKIAEVRVNVDFTTRVDQTLRPAALEMGEVTVVGERNPLVRQDLTNTQVAVTADVIDQLPVDQISDVVRLQAGVVQDNSGALHIRGGRSNEIAYQVNGISINNPFSNLQAVGLATNAVQEVSVSAGTFSAEYGNALSGVINFVTKDGGSDYSGSLKAWTGDNLSSHKETFFNIDDVDVFNNNRVEWTFGGPMPLFGNALTFFTSGVRQNDKGHLYGIRVYAPTDILLREAGEFGGEVIAFDPYGDGRPSGDRAIVPMVTRESLNLTAKLTWKPSPRIKIHYDLILDDGENFPRVRNDVNIFRRYRFNPEGRAKTYENGANHSIGLTHTLSPKTFYTLKFGAGTTHSKTYVYENPLDTLYVASFNSDVTENLLPPLPADGGYIAGGTDLDRSWDKTRSFLGKLDVVSQIHPAHELKFGGELQYHRLEIEAYTLLYDLPQRRQNGGVGQIVPYPYLDPDYTDYQYYKRKPTQAAAYVQDKMELAKSFIFNLGARLEYVYSNALYNPDLVGTVDTGVDQNLKKSDPKLRLSPRASLSFPITDRGIIRFSYGHFYQNPTFNSIYRNPRFEDFNFVSVPNFGNTNLEPQRSIQYEMGLQQQFSEDFKADLTVFYKDVTNLIQNRRVVAGEVAATREFNVVTNISYANVKGFTIALLKRKAPEGLLSATLDYTFQIAEGAFDDPLALAIDTRSGRDTEQRFVPLDHDRTHTLNATLTLSKTNNWALSAIGNVWTGTPYTPTLPSSVQPVRFESNSARRPLNMNVDLKLEKFFRLGGLRYSLFVQVENALDRSNERFVHQTTGRSLTALEETLNPNQFASLRRTIENIPQFFFPIRFLDEFYQREDWLAEPREIRGGFTLEF